jgi:hypothetical protein
MWIVCKAFFSSQNYGCYGYGNKKEFSLNINYMKAPIVFKLGW